MRKSTFAGIIGLSLLATSALAQTESEFFHNGWTGHKRANDPDNGCIMGKHVTKDVYFVVYANANEGFGFGVSVSSWDLPVGDEWSGSVTFDDHEPILLTGTVIEPEIVLFPGGAEEDSLAPLLSSSRQMRLSYGHSKFGLSLKGSSKALDLLGDCAENRLDQSSPQLTQQHAQPGPSLTSLPIKSGYYALTGGTCEEGFGPNTIYIDGKTLSWPSSGCRFEYISQTGQSTYDVKQTCGRNSDDIGTEQATYTVKSKISFTMKSGTWEEKGNYCEPSTLPIADRERADPPIYAPSDLGSEPSSAPAAKNHNSIYQERLELLRKQNEERAAKRKTESDTFEKESREVMRELMAKNKSPFGQIERGKAIVLSGEEEAMIKSLIGLRLRDESSALYRNIAAAEMSNGAYVVCGYVNGKNQYGAYAGYTPFYSNYDPSAKNFIYFIMANHENIPALCRVNGVVAQ